MTPVKNSELTPALISAASQILRDTMGQPMGYEYPFSIDGVRYVAKVEWHYNTQKGKHRGITLYRAAEVVAAQLATDILAVTGLEKTSVEFRRELVAMCARLGANPDHIATVMAFETGGSFDPAEPNKAGSGAVGLIQFMRPTARGLGTTTLALAQMSAVQQLRYVERYFAQYRKHLTTLENCYLAVYKPALINRSLEYVVARRGSKEYEQNIGFDRTRRGYYTVRDVTETVRRVYSAAGGRRIPVDAPATAQRRTLKLGMTGEDVVEWQRVVGATADGYFGPKTESATKVWQFAHKLTADGIVGPKSYAAAGLL